MISAEGHALFRERCEAASSFVLATHIFPDGDALGSQLSLARFLTDRGKQVRIVNRDPTPRVLRFMADGAQAVEIYDPRVHDAALARTDLVVLVDNSATDRLGEMEPVMLSVADRTLCIDHHPSRAAPWAHQIVDESSCATTAMIYELTRACGWRPDPAAAQAMYVGLATDTGFFRFRSTNARAHAVASELLAIGVEPSLPYHEIYERNSVAFTHLMGHSLAGLRMLAGGALVQVRIDAALLRELGAEDVDTSEIATSLLAIDGIRLALLFRELPAGRVKVSLRSRGAVDVHLLASEFGGGGHRNASGIVMEGGLDAVAETVTARAIAVLGR